MFDFSRYANIKKEDGTKHLLAPYRPSREEVLNDYGDHLWVHRNVTVIYNYGTKNKATLGSSSSPSKASDTAFQISHEELPRTWMHEFGHSYFGLSDIYWHGGKGPDSNYGGTFDIMGDNNSNMPPMMAWSLIQSELQTPETLVTDNSIVGFIDNPSSPSVLPLSCGTIGKPCYLYDNTQDEFNIIKIPAIIERDSRKVVGHYYIESYGNTGYSGNISLRPETIAFEDQPGVFPGGIGIWKVDTSEQKINTGLCRSMFPSVDHCNKSFIRNNGSLWEKAEFYPSLPMVTWGDGGKSTSSYHLFPWWYSEKLPFAKPSSVFDLSLQNELDKMPTEIKLPVLEIPPFAEESNYGGGKKVAEVTISFKDLISTMKQNILDANKTNKLSLRETYLMGGRNEFLIEVVKITPAVNMTYKDHIREGQKDFLVGAFADEVLLYGYHIPNRGK
jgi:hypothetical protein